MEEQVVKNERQSSLRAGAPAATAIKFAEFRKTERVTLPTGNAEIDGILGTGLVAGGVYLLAGDPGVGKSTLALQIALALAGQGRSVFYVSGEESAEQVGDRVTRLQISKVAAENLQLVSSTALEEILATLENFKPELVVLDSVQTVSSLDSAAAAGSPSQVREVTVQMVDFAKQKSVPVVLIGHITKSGTVAGPKALEHLVDAVLFLEGSRDHSFRLLRGLKNRFGSTDTVGVFEMHKIGLQIIKNPSEYLLRDRSAGSAGVVIAVAQEGQKPLLAEVQALVSRSGFGYPRRTTSGCDLNRVQLLIGVLQKHAGLKLADQDIFLNVVGGFKINDRAADLALALAVASSFLDKPLPDDLAVFGEIGLSGEVRSVPGAEKRVREAHKLGFSKILAPVGTTGDGVFVIKNLAEAVARLREM